MNTHATIMKAIILEKYGAPEYLNIQYVNKPFPKNKEVLIRIYNATVTSGDCRIRALNVPFGFKFIMQLILGFTRPRQPILGSELSGTIEAMGNLVTKFDINDHICAFTDMDMGCYAQYICLPENALIIKKPTTLNFQEAAAMSFGGSTALYFLKRLNIHYGDKILIYGASGGVGTAMVQLARYFGAEITCVCDTSSIALVTSLGADHVIDYTQEIFYQNGQKYDVIIDTIGNIRYSNIKNSLNHGGSMIMLVAGIKEFLLIPWISLTTKHQLIAGTSHANYEGMHLLSLLAERRLFRPVIDRCFPYTQIVDAHQYVDSGHKKGNVILSFFKDGQL